MATGRCQHLMALGAVQNSVFGFKASWPPQTSWGAFTTDFLYDLLSVYNLCDNREKHPAGLGSAGGFGVTQ